MSFFKKILNNNIIIIYYLKSLDFNVLPTDHHELLNHIQTSDVNIKSPER